MKMFLWIKAAAAADVQEEPPLFTERDNVARRLLPTQTGPNGAPWEGVGPW